MNKPILKIAIIGEGKNDVGIEGQTEWQDGTIQTYLNRFLSNDFTLEFHPIQISKNEAKSIKTLKGGRYRKYKIRGVGKKIFRFVQKYQKNASFDLLIFFADTDKTQGERATKIEALKKYKSVLNDIEIAQQLVVDEMSNLHFVPMIPIRILECWLLGDNTGFENINCYPKKLNLPSSPEFIWGAVNDPSSNYPKHYLNRFLTSGGLSDTTETYQALVSESDFQTLRKNCPNSFEPFYQKMEQLKLIFLESK